MTGEEDKQQITTPSGRNWTKWKTATVVYGISFMSYIIAYFHFGKAEMHVEIATLIFSITPVYIVLFWSLDETRKGTKEQIETLQNLTSKQVSALENSTKLQIESFSKQSQGIVSAIQQVVGAIGQMSEENRKRKEEQEEKEREEKQRQHEANIRAQEKEAQKDWEEKQRIAPRIFARIADEPFFFLFRHYRLYLFNSGGIAKNIELAYFFSNSHNTAQQTVSIGSLSRNRGSRFIDCGDVPALSAYTAIQVSISLRDNEERLYVGTMTIDKSSTEWVQIPLEERRGE